MNTFFLLFIVVIYLIISLSLTKIDYFAPSNIVMVVYILSLFFLFGEMNKWDGNLSTKGVLLLVIGISVYLIISLVTYIPMNINNGKILNVENKHFGFKDSYSLPNIDTNLTKLIILYEIFALFKYYLDIKRSALSLGSFSTFGGMLYNYRLGSAYGVDMVGISKLSGINYLILGALAYTYMGYLIQYLVTKEEIKLKWKILHLTPIIVFAACSLLNGGRNTIIQLILAFVTMYFIQYRKFFGQKIIEFRKIVKIIFIGLGFLLAFSGFRNFAGRTSTLQVFDYLAMYIGAPIKLFDLFVNDYIPYHALIGQETFASFWRSLGYNISFNMEFRSVNGFGLGNVYTPFRRYYSDFGWMGIIFLTGIQSFFYTFFYSKVKKRLPKHGKIDIWTIIYCYLVQGVFYYSIVERLYLSFMYIETLKLFIAIIFFSVLLPKIKLKF